MAVETKITSASPAELLGDAHPLLEQLGVANDLALTDSVSSAIELRHVRNLPALRSFLEAYRAQVLVPVELPAIVAAYQHAARGELKELLALDEKLARDPAIRPFAAASCRVGQRQLSKLRPLRDQRLVQRYLNALAEGRARGWHTLVYGVSLAMFSVPLRQGLQHYTEQTLRGFIDSSARALRLTEADSGTLWREQAALAPGAVATAMQGTWTELSGASAGGPQ